MRSHLTPIFMLMAGCASSASGESTRIAALESRISELEIAIAKSYGLGGFAEADNIAYWCPRWGSCFPENRRIHFGLSDLKSRDDLTPEKAQEWMRYASQLAVETCWKRASNSASSFPERGDPGPCVRSRLVICNTHDSEPNICFSTWALCEDDRKHKPNAKECAAYFDGKRIDP